MKNLLNIFCGLMLLFPFAANCQTNLKGIDPRDIKVEIGKYGDTTRYYYDENDNKILHGKQVKNRYGDYRIISNYNHGILDGEYYYRYNDGNRDNYIIITGLFNNGKFHSLWTKYEYEYSTNTKKFTESNIELWDNGKLVRFQKRRGEELINCKWLDETYALIENGRIILENTLLDVSAGIVINAFLRQNGEFEVFDKEMQELFLTNFRTICSTIDTSYSDEERYRILTKRLDSVFIGTNFRLNTITIENPPFSYETMTSSFTPNTEYNYEPRTFKLKILTRIKYTTIEEIDTLNIELTKLKYDRENLSINSGEIYYYIEPRYEGKDDEYPFNVYTEHKYYINPKDTTKLDEYINEYINEMQRREEQAKRNEEYLKELNKVESFERYIYHKIKNYNILSSYRNIRSTMIKDSYDSITEQDIDFLKEFIKFSEEFKTSFVDKEIDVKFNNNDKKIKELANLYCNDILPIYQKEITNPSRVFSEISDFNSLTNDYEVAIKKQEDLINYLTKREIIKNKETSFQEDLINYLTKREIIENKETSFYPKNTNYQHLVKFYEDYKKSFDFSWGNNGDWLNRLNEFEDNQNEYIRCISLLQQVEEKDIAIIEESKKLKRIKKVYLEYKESLNFETIPHIDKNKSLVEFIDFQTKVLNNIKSKGEEVNDSLKKAKELKDKIEVLTK